MQDPKTPRNMKKAPMNYGIYILAIIVLFGSFFFIQSLFKPNTPEPLTPVEFESKLIAGDFAGMTIKYSPIGGEDANTYRVSISDAESTKYVFEIFMPALNDIILQIDPADNIKLTYVEKSTITIWGVLINIVIPVVLVIGLIIILYRTDRKSVV